MLSLIGYILLCASLLAALVQVVSPTIGLLLDESKYYNKVRVFAYIQFVFMFCSYMALTFAFLSNDFSILYVANNSNTSLPLMYKIAAVWGGHEGSLMLWVLILNVWTMSVCILNKALSFKFLARVLVVLGAVSVGFLAFIVFTSNPFIELTPPPLQGRDLNPLLQDPGMMIHPPMLYMGYVGFCVAFAFSIAGLMAENLNSEWAEKVRPWVLSAWVFLTAGIGLGSWWAYNELGWGGWWFWDPVENASFMPWLVGTALIHSVIVTQKRNIFQNWTALLAIVAFSLSLLGTFLVRSGVLVSVHAFANDPERGIFILCFLSLTVGLSLLIFAIKAHKIKTKGGFDIFSRETLLLINNIFLLVAAFTVLLGTLYPLIIDALNLGKLSVGPPYFNIVLAPLILPLLLFMTIAISTAWKSDKPLLVFNRLKKIALIAVISGIAFPLYFYMPNEMVVFIATILSIWTILGPLDIVIKHITKNTSLLLRAVSVFFAHAGVGILMLGIVYSSYFSLQKELVMQTNEFVNIGPYKVQYKNVDLQKGPNYVSLMGNLDIFKNEVFITRLFPEKRIYKLQSKPMTEAAIHSTLFHDLYISLGEPLQRDRWGVRIYYKPFMSFLWIGILFMFVGGIISISTSVIEKRKIQNTS